eukprot:jgi/Bigna1/71231/fgenesh1_pg.15_\
MEACSFLRSLVLLFLVTPAHTLWRESQQAKFIGEDTEGEVIWRRGGGYEVVVYRNRTFAVNVNAKPWLHSLPVAIHTGKIWYQDRASSPSSLVQPLIFDGIETFDNQHDAKLGDYDEIRMNFLVGHQKTPFSVAIQYFASEASPAAKEGLFLFRQTLPQGLVDANLLQWDAQKVFQSSNPAHKVYMMQTGATRDRRTVHWPNVGQFGATGRVSVMFPSFNAGAGLPHTVEHLSWMGRFAVARWGEGVGAPGGQEGGPHVVFDGEPRTGNRDTLVLAPFDNFKSNILGYDCSIEGLEEGAGAPARLCAGPHGYVKQLPAGYEGTTSLSFSRQGPTDAVHVYGELLRRAHASSDERNQAGAGAQRSFVASSKKNRLVEEDPLSTKISYWTDNGAFYSWYNYDQILERGTPEAVLSKLHAEFARMKLPVAYTQLDAYWFEFERENANCKRGVTEQRSLFPSGLKALAERLNTSFLMYDGPTCASFTPKDLHLQQQQQQNDEGREEEEGEETITMAVSNRYNLSWARGQLANAYPAPHARRYFDRLMASMRERGAVGYEIDFLDFNYLLFEPFNTDLEAAHEWLSAMGDAATAHSLPIQYCMPLPSDLLESVLHRAVTNARASHDYQPGGDNWNIGATSLLVAAVGLRPSKDNFRTALEGGALNALIATLSTGPVGFSDELGTARYDLLRRTCMADGTLLQPSRAPLPIDRSYTSAHAPPEGAHIWVASSEIGQETYFQVLAIEADAKSESSSSPLLLGIDDLYPRPPPATALVAWEVGEESCRDGVVATQCVTPLADDTTKWQLDVSTRSVGASALQDVINSTSESAPLRHKTWVISPVLDSGYALLGEHKKLVPVSPTRVLSVRQPDAMAKNSAGESSDGGINVTVAGSENESVELLFLVPGGRIKAAACTVPPARTACEILVH